MHCTSDLREDSVACLDVVLGRSRIRVFDGGVMVLEEAGVRGALGKALREAVTIARLMGSGKEDQHVNDTRQG